MTEQLELGQSAEDYLEAVFVVAQSGSRVRVTDIADRLAVSKPSVVSALSALEGKGLVRHERYGSVELTARGAVLAQEVYRRHRLLQEFLRDVLGVPDEIAAEDACRMEHVLSPETLERLVRLVEFMRAHGRSDDVTLGRLLDCLSSGKCRETGSGKPKRSKR